MDETTDMTDAPPPDDPDPTDEVLVDVDPADAELEDATGELPPPPFADTPNNPPPPTGAPTEGRLGGLRRGADPRVAGVCDGLARHFNIDPLLVRIGFVVGAVIAFPLVFGYLLLWVVLPKADGSTLGDERGRSFWGAMAIGLGVIVLAATVGDDINFEIGGGLFVPLALFGIGLWLLLETPGSTSTEERAQGNRLNIPTYPVRPASPAAEIPRDPVTGAPLPVAPVGPPAPPEPRSPITPLVLSALAIGVGVVALLNQVSSIDISVTQTLAGAIIIVGAGLAASAVFGRSRGLGVIGGLLILALAISATVEPSFRGGIGEQFTVVDELTGATSEYEFGIGEYRVDFRRVELTEDHRATVEFGVGELRVIVPNDINVIVEAELGAGEMNALGESSSGFDNDEVARRIVDPDGPTLTLEVDQLIGEMKVCHGDPPPPQEFSENGVPLPPAPGTDSWVCGR